jgi:membrane protease YdiL (CAAX protease family)
MNIGLARIWRRLPVAVRAVIAGALVLQGGNLLTGPLVLANLTLLPAVPWSVPLLAAYVWFYWQYLQGRWWPRSTAEARRRGLRANRLSSGVWRSAMAAGSLALAASFALQWVVGRLTPLGYGIPAPLQQFPVVTLLAVLLTLSVVAGIVEEAAFRGYMQGPIEKRHGIAAAILVVSAIFGAAHLTDLQPAMTVARMTFIVLAAVLYGIMVHLTDSILPGLVIHATGNAIGLVWIWALSRNPGSRAAPRDFAAASSDPQFLVTCGAAVVFSAAAVWAFRRLAQVTRSERLTGEYGSRVRRARS